MNYTVRKFKKGEEIRYQPINVGSILGIRTVATSTYYAVVDESGNIVVNKNGQEECYPLKSTALKVAEWYNK